MQPYQEASEEVQRQGDLPIKAAANIGGLIVGGIALKGAGRVLPFLSKYIPSNLTIKGLEKVDPRYGKFIQKALKEGTPMDEIKDFIREKAESAMPKQKEKSKNGNIIEQYDPELHSYILDKIKQGKSHLYAGTKALGHERFKKAIDKIVKDHKTSWSEILQSVYGGQGTQQSQNESSTSESISPQQQQGSEGVDPELDKIIQGGAALLKKYRG